MQKLIIFIVVVILWGFTLRLFKTLKMNFFLFLAGSIGVFTISLIFFQGILQNYLNALVSGTLYVIGNATNYFQVFRENSVIALNTKDGVISIFITYECSGVIEMLVFTSLALFFPFGKTMRRAISLVIGNIYIFAANIVRMMFIILAVKVFGISSFYLVHTLFARILFFALMVVLYYFAFTTTHLKHQNVGEM